MKWVPLTDTLIVNMFLNLLVVTATSLHLGKAFVTESHDGLQYSKSSQSRPYLHYDQPTFLQPGQSFKATVGTNVTLPCNLANPKDFRFVWKHGQTPLLAGQINADPEDFVKIRSDLRISITDSSSLFIHGVDILYSGNYTCEIEWSDSMPPKSISHYLEVLVPPKVYAVHVDKDNHVEVEEGKNVTLMCKAEGTPQPKIEWNSTVWPRGRRELTDRLHLERVDRTQAGRYTCTAFNGVGRAASAHIQLIVLHSPSVLAVPRVVKSWPGEKARLTCEVRSIPPASVMWYFRDQQLRPNFRLMMEENNSSHSLVLRDISEDDLGNYTCQAINNIGEDDTLVMLSGIPLKATVTSPSVSHVSNSYKLKWDVKSFGPVLETKIEYRECGSYSWRTISSSDSDQIGYHEIPSSKAFHYNSNGLNPSQDEFGQVHKPQMGSFVFKGLRPDCKYQVRLTTRNKFGWTDEVSDFAFKTSTGQMSSGYGSNSGVWGHSNGLTSGATSPTSLIFLHTFASSSSAFAWISSV